MKTRVGGRRGRLLSVVATAALAGAATLATATPASANSGDLSNRLPIIGSVRVSATWAHPAGEPYGHTTGDGGTGSASPAIDFAPSSAAPTSTPVVSSGNGLVVGTGYQYPGAGHWISVYHAGDNRTSSYLHLAAAPLVAKGSRVAAGQRLGTMGGSGGVATHLHYQEKAGSISTTPTRDNRLDPGVLTGCTSGPLNFQNWRGRYNFSVSNYFRSCPSATVTGFSSNASSSLTVDSARNLRLTVCSSNLAGQKVTVHTTRAGRDFGLRTLYPTGTCATFTDLEGTGAVLSGATYYTKVAMNQTPNQSWNSSCGALTNLHGLCDSRTAP
ncbi:M23 family metallopeptidase [Knoellia sp. LjRoot47]|uniref:M23 family metallopeptidase n=1 Tax=Knoellia sp. LjRoot47 TaxID=3342330 RepID=UPI003ED0ADDE